MEYDWDEAKNRLNKKKHGISFEAVERFEWDSADIDIDDREDYGELREVALGFIGVVLYHLTYVATDDETIRIISLRAANTAEARRFARSRR